MGKPKRKIKKEKIEESAEAKIKALCLQYKDYLDWFSTLSRDKQEKEYELRFKESSLDVPNYIRDKPRQYGDSTEKYTVLCLWLDQNLP